MEMPLAVRRSAYSNQAVTALPDRRMVDARAGPVETMPTSVPASSAIRSTYRPAASGSAAKSRVPAVDTKRARRY